MTTTSVPAPFSSRRPLVLADVVPGAVIRDVALVLGGAAFVGIFAQIAIPVAGSPVPVTGQTFAALTVGTALGLWRGLAALSVYLVAGMAGLPWFAQQTSGYSMPSFGYVIGFVAAAALVGALASRGGDRSPLPTIATMLLGNAVIYAVGVPYLAWSLGIGLTEAFDVGMRNYLVGDGIKILLAAGVLPLAWRLVDRVRKG